MVARRDHAPHDDHDVGGVQLGQRRAQRGHQRQVPGGQRRYAHHVHIGLDRLPGDLFRCLEQRADVDVEAQVGEGGGDHLLAPVVTVLAHLGHQDARAAPLGLGELVAGGSGSLDVPGRARFVAIHPCDGTHLLGVPAEHPFQRVGDLPHGRLGAGGVHGQLEQVVLQAGRGMPGGLGERVERARHGLGVAFGPEAGQLGELLGAYGAVVDLEHVDGLVAVGPVLVHPDHRLPAGVDAGLRACGGLLDAQLGQPRLDGPRHPAGRLDLLDVGPGALGEVVGEAFDVVGAAPRVDHLRGAGLLLQQQLGVAGDAGGEVGGQGQRLVQGVGVQRLRVALGGGHGLDAGAGDVVVDVLRGQRPAGGLAVRTQAQRLRVLRPETPHEPGPQQPGGPQLGDLHEEVHADAPEERQARREPVDVQAGADPGAQVFGPVGEGVGQLQVQRGSGLLDVVAGDADGVELRHLLAGVGEDVGDDAHGRRRGIDVGVADHELFEDVVLDGPRELLGRDAPLLARHDVEREHGQHGAVHGHRHRHAVERDAVEELAHVVDGVDGHARHANVAGHPGVVGVVAPVGGQVEGHRQALLAGREVAPVEGVGVLRRGEAGVLADGPGLVDVHGRVRAPQEGGGARIGAQEVEAVEVGGGVEGLDRDALRGLPDLSLHVRDLGRPPRQGGQRDAGEVGDHRVTSRSS